MGYEEIIRRKNKILCFALFASILLRGIVNAVFMGIGAVIGLVVVGMVLTGILLVLAMKLKPAVMMYLMVVMLTGISVACMVAFPCTTNYLMFFLAVFMIVLYEDIRPIVLQCLSSIICIVIFYFLYRQQLAETWSMDAMVMCIVYIVSAMFVFGALCRLTGQQFAHLENVNAESLAAKDKAEHLLDKIKDSVGVLGNASGAIWQSIDATEEISGQISVGAEDVAKRAVEEVGATETIRKMVETCVKKIQEVASASRDMTEISNATSDSVLDGGNMVQQLNKQMSELNDKMNAIAFSMTELNQENEKIMGILQTLNKITAQTNLLSLNASIEAARAGEHGRGFAVVATEIRELSENSSRFTEQIHGILDGIRIRTNQVKEEVEAGQQFMEMCSQHTGQVDSSFQSIASNTKQVLEQARKIEMGSGEMVTLLEETRGNVNDINENVEATSAAMEEITASIMSLHGNVDAVASEYHNINEITKTLILATER